MEPTWTASRLSPASVLLTGSGTDWGARFQRYSLMAQHCWVDGLAKRQTSHVFMSCDMVKQVKHWPWRSWPGIFTEHPGAVQGWKVGRLGGLCLPADCLSWPLSSRPLRRDRWLDDLWRTQRMTKARPNRPPNATSTEMNLKSIKSLKLQDKEGKINNNIVPNYNPGRSSRVPRMSEWGVLITLPINARVASS